MSDVALKFVLDTLKDSLINHIKLKQGAQDEFENLEKELQQLVAHLMDAAEMPKKSFVFKVNERQIRNVVYKVEDTIEIYLTKKAAAKTKRILSRLWAMFSANLEQKVKDLRLKTVAPALNLLMPLGGSVNTNTGDGSLRSLEQPGSENTEAVDVDSVYNGLPYHQKLCFLYTGLFPPGAEIKASTLTQLWVAEKFIRPENGKSLEETARAYLKHLIDKKLLMPEKQRFDKVKTCRVDAKTREFSQNKATEENLFTLIVDPLHSDQDFYRLCFHSDPSNFLSKVGTRNWLYVRSFLCLVKEHLNLPTDTISTIPSSFKPLRILSCESTKFEELPKITSLILLKHITLSIDNLYSLPEDISQLINLETLIVRTQSHFIQVKANIWKMMKLRHLKTKVSFVTDKKWEGYKGAAENLQTISRLAPESCSKELFEKAPNLKTLGIRGKLEGDLDASTLVRFSNLENLKLENFIRYGSARDNPVLTLPPADDFPCNLKRLTLSRTFLIWNTHMRVLAGIHKLEILKVKDNAFKGAFWRVAGVGFQKLRFLLIENTDLFKWEASTEQFPKLECVVLRSCENRPKLPPSLEDNVKINLDIDEVSRNPNIISDTTSGTKFKELRSGLQSNLSSCAGLVCTSSSTASNNWFCSTFTRFR